MFKAYKRYFDFKGRSGRKEYWLFVLWMMILAVAALAVDSLIFRTRGDAGPAYILVILANLIPGLAVTIRRLHDTGRTGWWMLISLIPIVGSLVLLVFTLLKGQPEANRFGPPDGDASTSPVAEPIVS